MRKVLTKTGLDGVFEVHSLLRPERPARLVGTAAVSGLLDRIDYLCQVWGGGVNPLLPVVEGDIPQPYRYLVPRSEIDCLDTGAESDIRGFWRLPTHRGWDFPTLLLLGSKTREDYRPVVVSRLNDADPWKPIYAACLGSWPDVPSEALNDRANVRSDFTFDDVVPTRFEETEGSVDDLCERLIERRTFSPRGLSCVFLASGVVPDTSFMGSEAILPQPRELMVAAGPNIVVACSEGSVEDLCLLWNLRGAHQMTYALPIGVPAGELDADILHQLEGPGRTALFGLSGGRIYLTSTSVPVDQLRELAEAAGPRFRVAEYDALLDFGPAAARGRRQVATWSQGTTRLVALADEDLEVLRATRGLISEPNMFLSMTVDDNPLPVDPGLRGPEFVGPWLFAAQATLPVNLRSRGTLRVTWPSGWTVLQAMAKDRGLEVEESPAGRSAMALLEAAGGVSGIRWLLDPALLRFLEEMSESAGTNRLKAHWRRTGAQLRLLDADPARVDELMEAAFEAARVPAPRDEGREYPMTKFKAVLGGHKSARAWLEWAESRRLIVRGVTVDCTRCGSQFWIPMAAVRADITCPGCGRDVPRPFGVNEIRFHYRLGEPLRRALEDDCIGHVLLLYYFAALLPGSGFVGAHPGVNVYPRGDRSRIVGEADLLMILWDGSVVPCEVKRSATGVQQSDLSLLESLAEAWRSPWTVLAVNQPARDCPDFGEFARWLPDAPRLTLTYDQTMELHPIWALGSNPFAWEPRGELDDAERAKNFRIRLRDMEDYNPLQDLEQWLLLDEPDETAPSNETFAAPVEGSPDPP